MTEHQHQPIPMGTNFSLASAVPLLLLFAAFLTNPSPGDFEQYRRHEFGVLNVAEYRRTNLYVLSLYEINSLSFRKGEDRRSVLGIFGTFVELNQTSSW